MKTMKVAVDGQIYDMPYASDEERDAKLAEMQAEEYNVSVVTDDAVKGATHGTMQGLTFGFGDEIYAGLKSINPFDDDERGYKQIRDQYRNELAGYKEANPVAYAGGEIAGSLPSMLVPGGAAVRGVQGASKAGKLARLGAIGAAEGGLAGFGYSDADNAGGMLGDVGTGALIGGVAAPVMQVAAPIVGRGALALKDSTLRGAKREATDALAEVLQSTGRSADDIVGDLASMGGSARLIDIDPALLEAAAATRTRSNEAVSAIEQFTQRRQEGARNRIVDALEDAANIKNVRERAPGLGTKIKGLGGRVGESYDKALNIEVPKTAELERFLAQPKVQSYVREVAEDWQLINKTDINPFEGETIPGEVIDMLKKQLDEGAKGLRMPGVSPAKRGSAYAMATGARNLLGDVDPDMPGYSHARDLSQKQIKMREALAFGRDNAIASDKSVSAAEEMMGQLSPREQIAMRTGMLESVIKNDLGKPGQRTGDIAGRIYNAGGDNIANRRLGLLARDAQSLGKLKNTLDAERTMNESLKFLSNKTQSRTSIVDAAGDRMAETASAVQTAANSMNDVSGTIMKLAGMGRMSREGSAELANMLVNKTAGEQALLVRQLMSRGEIPETLGDTILQSIERGVVRGVTRAITSPLIDEATD